MTTKVESFPSFSHFVDNRASVEMPILQSFIVKTNLSINIMNFVNSFDPLLCSGRSGTIIALKYKDIIKGNGDLFKTTTVFKNACHLVMYHTCSEPNHQPQIRKKVIPELEKRCKKIVHIKITAIGTFQVVGVPIVDVEKLLYKLFLIFEKANKDQKIYKNKSDNRLEMVIVPILNNYMITLSKQTTEKIFKYTKTQLVQKFVEQNFLSFMLPNDPAITIKKSYVYSDYSRHPVRYIVWNKVGKTVQHIEYDSYTTLLNGVQKTNAQNKKYVTMRLYSTGKILISGFNDLLVQNTFKNFCLMCHKCFV